MWACYVTFAFCEEVTWKLVIMLHEKVSGCRNIKALSNLPFKPCNGSSIRERSAESLRQPEDGKSCPAATETEVCTLNKNCYHYDYNVTGICGATIQWQLGTKASFRLPYRTDFSASCSYLDGAVELVLKTASGYLIQMKYYWRLCNLGVVCML